jgi:ATP-dependent 26S proteasome regulatory subunit
MDGVGSDADIIFLLTTNRADLLEPALATRPGRVDLAVEIPLPDPSCRRRLLQLYGREFSLPTATIDRMVERTEGVSASFIKELLRRAALLAVTQQDSDTDAVTDSCVDDALDELLHASDDLTRALLGARRNEPAVASPPAGFPRPRPFS